MSSCQVSTSTVAISNPMRTGSHGGIKNEITAFDIVLVLPTVNFQPMRALAQTKSSQSNRAAEILWDTWGAPHIFAKDAVG